MDINIEELLKMVEKENNDYKKQIYELKLQVDVLTERLAIQKVEFEEEVEQLKQYKNLCARKTADIFELEKEKQELKQKLEKIKEECKQAPAIDTELSLRILEIVESES